MTRSLVASTAAALLCLMCSFGILGEAFAQGAVCPGWITAGSFPVCPSSNNSKLPDTFPGVAFVISDRNGMHYPAATATFTEDVVERIFLNSGSTPPLMLLPVDQWSFDSVASRIRLISEGIPARRDWPRYLVRVDGSEWAWQQDFFDGFLAGDRRLAVGREVRGYKERRGADPSALINALASLPCAPARTGRGEILPVLPEGYRYDDPASGGNIEALPGGLCMAGVNQLDVQTRDYCGDTANQVRVNTSFLQVGHADEIINVMRTGNGACDFVVGLASPRKALELLDQNPNEPFWGEPVFGATGLYTNRPLPPRDVYDHRLGNKADSEHPLMRLCAIAQKHAEQENREVKECRHILNGEIADTIRNYKEFIGRGRKDRWIKPLAALNAAVQALQDSHRALIASRVASRTGCTVRFVDLPELNTASFLRNAVTCNKQSGETKILDGSTSSFNPSATNGVMAAQAYLIPHPQNRPFAKYYENGALAQFGIRYSFVDTYEAAHVLLGNLHCRSQMVRVCRG